MVGGRAVKQADFFQRLTVKTSGAANFSRPDLSGFNCKNHDAYSGGGAVAKCVEIRFGIASDDENIGSSCQVNALRDGLLGKRLPTIDLAHVNLA